MFKRTASLVAVFTLVSFGLFAQDFTSELATRNHHFYYDMSTSVEVVPTATATTTSRHRAVGKPAPPVVTPDYDAAVMVQKVGNNVWAGYNCMTPTYDGAKFETIVIAPDGSVYSDRVRTQLTFQTDPSSSSGDIYFDVPPAKWGVGFAIVKLFVNGQFVAFAKMPVGMDVMPQVGPLQSAIGDDFGGVVLSPEFSKTPTVTLVFQNVLVPVQGTNYIPPKALVAGQQIIAVRDNLTLECSTADVEVK